MNEDAESVLQIKFDKAINGNDHASGFACSCSPEHEAELKGLREWAYNELSNPKYPQYACTAENFLSKFIYEMGGQYKVYEFEFPFDMWGAVVTSTAPRAATQFSTFIQCDNFEDGLALTLKAYREKFGDAKNELQKEEIKTE